MVARGESAGVTITHSTRKAIDVYTVANLAALKQWPKDRLFFSLQDVWHNNVTITPYFRSRLADVLAAINAEGLTSHSVIVMANSLSGNLICLYGRVFASHAEPIHQHWMVGCANGEAELARLLQKYG